jgi:uncharacterized membrane protein/predicted RNA-binding Zn-ribbon protein involved in translation (DUF1610 family)
MTFESPVDQRCRKCGHIRQRGEEGPDYACPSCGGVYAKVREAALRREEEAREAARNVDFTAFKPSATPAAAPLPESLMVQRRREGQMQMGYILQLVPLGITGLVGALLAKQILATDTRSWLASHARWQIRTFVTALVLGLVLALIATLLVGGTRLAARMGGDTTVGRSGAAWLWLPATALWFWVMYRVARGWLRLVRGERA